MRASVARRVAAAAATAGLSLAALDQAPGAGAAVAQPPPEHRAAVIVDTGTEVRRVCVRFTEESLTGIEALVRAGTDPVLRAFAGKGAAVCALCGTGCPGDESCLTCDPAGRFWSYSRAPSGTGALRTSGVGASSTTVRDGDVEGWRWGTGGTPPFATVAEVCGEVAATTTTSTTAAATTVASTATTTASTATTAASPVTTAPGGGAATIGRPAPRSPATAATVPPATTTAPTATAGGSPAPTPPEGSVPPTAAVTTTAPAGGDLASSRRRGTDGGGPWGLAAFAATLAGLAGWSAAARRRRRHRPGG